MADGNGYGWTKESKMTMKLTPVAPGAPATLWLTLSRKKQQTQAFPPEPYALWVASGTAHISTREDGGDSVPVETLRVRIAMPGIGVNADDQTRNNAADCPASCSFTGGLSGDFSARWDVWVTQPGYGTQTMGQDW